MKYPSFVPSIKSPKPNIITGAIQLLKFGHSAFETKDVTKKEQHLEHEVRKLKSIIGGLTVELKKNDF